MATVKIVTNNFPEGDDRITRGNCSGESYAAWLHAIELAKYLASKGKVTNAEFEDPDDPLIWHGCTITLQDNCDYNADELKTLSELFSQFDGLTLITDEDEITLTFVKHIYQ